MRNLSGNQRENGRVRKSEQQQVRHFSIKRVTRKFLEVFRCGRTKQRQRNLQKKCAARAKLFFAN